MTEAICEPNMVCKESQNLYKGIFASDLAFVTLAAPYTASDIIPRLQESASAAAQQCVGGNNHTLCGQRWYNTTWDGTANMESQMSATSLFASNLVVFKNQAPATEATASNTTVSNSTETTASTTTSTGSASTGSSSTDSTGENAGSVLASGSLGITAGIVGGVIAVAQVIF